MPVGDDDLRLHVAAGLHCRILPAISTTRRSWRQGAYHLADTAAALHAGSAVIATRGHSPVVGALRGGVTARLIRLAHCPVPAAPPRTRGPAKSAPTAGTGGSVPAAA